MSGTVTASGLGGISHGERTARGISQRNPSVVRGGTVVGVGDEELIEQFAAGRDEAAFAALLARHGPMVLVAFAAGGCATCGKCRGCVSGDVLGFDTQSWLDQGAAHAGAVVVWSC